MNEIDGYNIYLLFLTFICRYGITLSFLSEEYLFYVQVSYEMWCDFYYWRYSYDFISQWNCICMNIRNKIDVKLLKMAFELTREYNMRFLPYLIAWTWLPEREGKLTNHSIKYFHKYFYFIIIFLISLIQDIWVF